MWTIRGTVLAITLAAGLTGCAGSAGDAVGVPPEDATVVVGSSVCTLASLGDELVDGVRVITERFECDDTMSDPRVTGTEVLPMTTRLASGVGGTWSAPDTVLTTDGGTWRGWAQGVLDMTGAFPLAKGIIPFNYGEAHYVGEGAYEGLEYHLYMSGSNEDAGLTGWITSTG